MNQIAYIQKDFILNLGHILPARRLFFGFCPIFRTKPNRPPHSDLVLYEFSYKTG